MTNDSNNLIYHNVRHAFLNGNAEATIAERLLETEALDSLDLLLRLSRFNGVQNDYHLISAVEQGNIMQDTMKVAQIQGSIPAMMTNARRVFKAGRAFLDLSGEDYQFTKKFLREQRTELELPKSLFSQQIAEDIDYMGEISPGIDADFYRSFRESSRQNFRTELMRIEQGLPSFTYDEGGRLK